MVKVHPRHYPQRHLVPPSPPFYPLMACNILLSGEPISDQKLNSSKLAIIMKQKRMSCPPLCTSPKLVQLSYLHLFIHTLMYWFNQIQGPKLIICIVKQTCFEVIRH
jgi:hypothetical protein